MMSHSVISGLNLLISNGDITVGILLFKDLAPHSSEREKNI